ncbi:hypothetical protein pb186bvf_004999 [Paramecium bursaria]
MAVHLTWINSNKNTKYSFDDRKDWSVFDTSMHQMLNQVFIQQINLILIYIVLQFALCHQYFSQKPQQTTTYGEYEQYNVLLLNHKMKSNKHSDSFLVNSHQMTKNRCNIKNQKNQYKVKRYLQIVLQSIRQQNLQII